MEAFGRAAASPRANDRFDSIARPKKQHPNSGAVFLVTLPGIEASKTNKMRSKWRNFACFKAFLAYFPLFVWGKIGAKSIVQLVALYNKVFVRHVCIGIYQLAEGMPDE